MTFNRITKEMEFGGVNGVILLTFGLPLFTIWINKQLTPDVNFHTAVSYYFNLKQSGHLWLSYLGWFCGLVLMDIILPGQWVRGTKLRDGSQLLYKINGIWNCLLLILILGLRWLLTDGKMPELQYLYENYLELAMISIIFSFALSIFVYLNSFNNDFADSNKKNKKKLLSLGGNTTYPIYDWFIGRELNPRFLGGSLDLKLFCELRPGLLLWFLINLSCLHHNYLQGKNLVALTLITALQSFYVFDGVLNEEGLLSMMDIVSDGFGFMLAFGDLTFVPFTYALQARYLSVYESKLSMNQILLIVSIMSMGYYIFHSSNLEKSRFRQGKLPHLKSITTNKGTKLLVDSWWAKSQHINYMGDWFIALSWCLTTWFNTPLTYYYCIYFAILLLHRQRRDELKCSRKYGEDWAKYQELVPYKIIPYVY